MSYHSPATFDDPTGETDAILRHESGWEAALQATSSLAVVFALSLAFILILAHQLGQPI